MPDYARVCRECGATLPDDWQRPDGTFECCFCGRVGEPAFKRAFTAPAGSWPQDPPPPPSPSRAPSTLRRAWGRIRSRRAEPDGPDPDALT